MDNLGGYKVCGKRGGASFLNAVRPNKDLECPDSYMLCDPTSQDSNSVICVQEDDLDNCPITDITLDIDSERVASVRDTYRTVDTRSHPAIHFSKHGGQRPITEVRLAPS